ncbi:MAG: HAMP domain-containing sensor histidine kinase, partial [Salinivirgaceae bacterium]
RRRCGPRRARRSNDLAPARSSDRSRARRPDEEKQEFINLLYDSSKQLHSLLENLLQWSRAQTGRLSFKPRKLQASKIVSDNFSLLNANAEVKNIELVNEVDPKAEVWADADMVNTIIRNLLTNAIKFSHKNSTVKITSESKAELLAICISDSGVGIREDELEKLFKIGYNTSKPGTANEEGTGLGLILCKEFAKRNGGDVHVESEVDKGSTFSFTLPIYKQS